MNFILSMENNTNAIKLPVYLIIIRQIICPGPLSISNIKVLAQILGIINVTAHITSQDYYNS